MKPNILFIMTDQHRFDALSSHGGLARTPVLDKLAGSGIDFRRFFTQAPVCVPSRCSLFTGRYPHAHRVRQNDSALHRDEIHWFKVLKQAGYHLGYFEKNHLLEDAEFENFDEHDFCTDDGGDPERASFLAFAEAQKKKLSFASWASAVFHDFPEEVTTPYVTREKACGFIRRAPVDKPFCLTVSFTDPHVPHLALKKYKERYPVESISLPEVPEGVLESKAPRYQIKREAQGSLRAGDLDKKKYLAVYAAMISWIDENVGAILKALEDRNVARNTIVVFTSDHGDFNFHYGMCKKDLVLPDALLRVPCLLSWPGRIHPRIEQETLVEQIDLMPTLLDLAGIEIPFGCQGKSLCPLIEGKAGGHKDEVFAEICYPWMRNPYPNYDSFRNDFERGQHDPSHPLHGTSRFNIPGDYCKMIRTKTEKYCWYGDGFEELYDLNRDPDEWCNLARDTRLSERKNQLKLRLFEWHLKTEDPLSPALAVGLNRSFDLWVKKSQYLNGDKA